MAGRWFAPGGGRFGGDNLEPRGTNAHPVRNAEADTQTGQGKAGKTAARRSAQRNYTPHPNAKGNPGANSQAHSNPRTDSNSHADTYSHSEANAHPDPQTHSKAHTKTNTQAYSEGHAKTVSEGFPKTGYNP